MHVRIHTSTTSAVMPGAPDARGARTDDRRLSNCGAIAPRAAEFVRGAGRLAARSPVVAAVLGLGALLLPSAPSGAATDVPELVAAPTEVVWVEFAPKVLPRGGVRPEHVPLSERALERRAARRTLPGLVDARDLPIDPRRLAGIATTGARLRSPSRWLNATGVEATATELAAIARLPYVRAIRPMRAARSVRAELDRTSEPEGGVAATDYGVAAAQLAQIDVPSMHVRGHRGEGIVIGVLDTGFHRAHAAFHSADHPLEVIAEWDFVANDAHTGIDAGDAASQHRHGTWILGTLAAYQPGTVVGAAYAARYVLAKTEDVSVEVVLEEDHYVAGLEFVEMHGADVATSSLGYIDWYVQSDLDGETAITTLAVNVATANGLVCVTAAGNAGNDADPATSTLIAPADAFEVITCGSVTSTGATSGFSSSGPTADGRVKPEVLARGSSTKTVHSDDASGTQSVSGTSLSTPLVAGVAALLLEARPDLDVAGVREALFATADGFLANGTHDPLFARGYGIVSAIDAARHGRAAADLNLDGAIDAADLATILAAWGDCADPDPATGFCPADLDTDGSIGASDLAAVLAAWGT